MVFQLQIFGSRGGAYALCIIGRLCKHQHNEMVQKMADVQIHIRNSLAIYSFEGMHEQTLPIEHRALAEDRIHFSPD